MVGGDMEVDAYHHERSTIRTTGIQPGEDESEAQGTPSESKI